jgi:hypothetical protein
MNIIFFGSLKFVTTQVATPFKSDNAIRRERCAFRGEHLVIAIRTSLEREKVRRM